MNKLAVIVFSALSLSATAALAADPVTVNGGTVHFKGEVVNAACAVDAGSLDQTVQLGQVRSAKLAVSEKAAIAFAGTAINSTNPTVLALQGSAAGGAINVGVQILDRTGTPLALDGATFGAQTTLSNGTNVIPFQARYFATGVATAGTANADATFKVQYE